MLLLQSLSFCESMTDLFTPFIHQSYVLHSLRQCTIFCHWKILEVASTELLNKHFVLFMFRWSFKPFKCLILTVLL